MSVLVEDWLYVCDKHDGEKIIHEYPDCPACNDIEYFEGKRKTAETRLRQKNKDIKLLKYELSEAREQLMLIKSEAAHYLTTKKEVKDMVDEHLA